MQIDHLVHPVFPDDNETTVCSITTPHNQSNIATIDYCQPKNIVPIVKDTANTNGSSTNE